MANSWFKFKQFMIIQDKTAMKVGTDGVLLGAWASIPDSCEFVLDIGTGTGLIALMIAQRSSGSHIDALEIDREAALQAQKNFENSKWTERLSVFNSSLQAFVNESTRKYDLIVCNPPFFSKSLRTKSRSRDLARYDVKLSLKDIFNYCSGLITQEGRLSIIIPAEKEKEAMELADRNNFHCHRITRVKPTPYKSTKRILLDYSLTQGEVSEEDLIIEEFGRHAYSEEYKRLTCDFYL